MFALLLAAYASAGTSVLVSAFEPATDDSVGLAALLEGYLAVQLESVEGLDVVRVEGTPPFEDYDARTYMDGCPAENVVGCTTVIAQRGKVRFAVTGTVRVLDGGASVDVAVLDMETSSIAVQFRSTIPAGDDQAFADAVARVLVAAVAGEVGGVVDIRDGDDAPARDNAALAKQIEELRSELGSAQIELTRPNKPLPRTAYTASDLAGQMEGDAMKPWERLKMSASEYLRYKNSGYPLVEWRRLAIGRQGQLILRPGIGFVNGPIDGQYYGAYGVDDSLATVDSWSAQTVQTGRGFDGSFAVAWGLAPFLEVGVQGGFATGHFTVEVSQQQIGDPVEATDPIRYQATTASVGPRVQATLLPVFVAHPVIGVGVDVAVGKSTGDFISLPAELTTYAPAPLVLGRLVVGGEVRLARRVDFYVHIPVTLVAGGSLERSAHVGEDVYVEQVVPAVANPVGWGITTGIQVRLFGKNTESQSVLEGYDEP